MGRNIRKRTLRELKRALVGVLVVVLLFSDLATLLRIPVLPEVSEAEAATGDFAIFRESAGTQTVASTTIFRHPWDTTVQSSGNITLGANERSIDLAEGGKYLVIYNSMFEEGTTTGSNRRSVESWLSLNGNEIPYGRASSYLRDSDGLTEAYISGGAVIDATAGDDLELRMLRNDYNPGGTNIAPEKDSISILKLKDSWDYLRIHASATSSDIQSNTTFTDVSWDTSDEVDDDSYNFSPTSADITLEGADGKHYLVTTNVTLFTDHTTNTRQNYEMRLTLNGVEIPGTRVTAYPRGSQNNEQIQYATLSYMGIITKNSADNQILNVEVRRESSNGRATYIVADESAISMVALPDTAEYIRLGDTSGTQTLSNTFVDMTWNDQQEVDTSAFSHSLVSNSDRIDIDKAGNYLFFATAYQTTSGSNNNRQPFTVNWKKTGTTQSRGSFGSYNRNNQNDSGGSSGAILLESLDVSDYIEIEHADESDNAPNDATFGANRVAIQGIALNDNLYGTDVVISTVGTHRTNVNIPTTDVYQGGKFVIEETTSSRNLTNITLTETGTVDAANGLANIELWYDLSTTSPYDCSEHVYDGNEVQYGSTDTNGFSGANGVSSFSGSISISTTQTFCGYVIYDVTATATDSETVAISIADNQNDITVTGGASIGPIGSSAPTGSTTLRNAELTQIHYHWRNDDGTELTATSLTGGTEDTPAGGFATGTIRRLRLEVSAEGSTSSESTAFRLEYGVKDTTCSAVSTWVDVGTGGGGDWDISETINLVDGQSTTNIGNGSGGVTDENASFITINNGVKDTGSQVTALTMDSDEFVEMEFAVEPTDNSVEGTSYCFRVTNAGTPLRNYNVYPEATVSADVTVSAVGTHTAETDIPSSDVYVGGTFVFLENTSSRNITDITVTEVGSVDATNLTNPRLFIDFDTTFPYDCASESYSGGETSVNGSAFLSANGTTTFTGSALITTTRTLCGYVVVDVVAGANHGESMKFQISAPNTDVVVDSGSVGPGSAVSMASSTYLEGPLIAQTHYHWRNDDGTESGATSATGGSEDVQLINVRRNEPYRLRLGVSNEGATTTTGGIDFRLQYGAKITSCDAISLWTDVGTTSAAWSMYNSTNITDGDDTTDVAVSSGGVTDENSSFVTNNNALKDTSSIVSSMDLDETEFTALEFSIEATESSGYDTEYCFRLTDDGEELNSYSAYAEARTAEKRDFRVQRGVTFIDVGSTATTITAGVDYTAPTASTSAFVRITNTQHTGAGDGINGGNQNANAVTANIQDPSNILSSITFERTSATENTRIAWEIVEYIGLTGADNEMKVRLQDTVTFGASALIATGSATTSIADDEDVVVFVTGQRNPDGSRNDYNTGVVTAAWASTTGQPVFTRGEAGGDIIEVSYAVVEFTGVNWNVQRVEHQYMASGTTEVENIDAINSLDRTFIHAQKRVGSGLQGLDEMGHEVWLSSLGAVSFRIQTDANTPSDHVSVAWVIENTQTGVGEMAVYRSDGRITSGGGNPSTHVLNIGDTLSNENNASIFANNSSTGNGTAFPRPILGARIISTTQYEFWRSDTGQNQDYRTEIVQWPIAEISVRQNYYRFYVDNDALTPTDPWPTGGTDLGENTSITVTDEPLGEGAVVRMRMSYAVTNATLPAGTQAFKLQFGVRDSSCSAIETWTDVGQTASGTIWRAHNGSPADGATLPSTLLFPSDISGTYEENNISAANPTSVNATQDIEYDWIVENNGALEKTTYCFRTVRSDGTVLEGYNNYPTLRTAGFGPLSLNWRWYDDEYNETPTTSLAAENSAPIDVANDNEIKLRVTIGEVAGANGTNLKFKLQYSEYSDFREVFDVKGAGSCEENDFWCYADGAADDNELISTSTLTDADSCVGGVGSGCGIHNEATTTLPSFVHGAFDNREYEFTIQHAGARVNTVYYFRLFNVVDDEPVTASSTYPSLVTEGATVVFTSESIATSTVIDGVTTDVATTPVAVPFGDLPFGSELEAAQRITVDTNGTEGYQVYVFSQNNLTSSNGEIIQNIAASNTAPLAWTTGCAVDGPSCFGYHPSDDTLSGGSTRFAPNDTYAALDGELGEIAYSSAPTANESVDVVYRVRVTEEQAAGRYEAGIVYIIVPIF